MLNGAGATTLAANSNVDYYDAVVNQQKTISLYSQSLKE